jgi:DNA-binding transcriptional regulator PaaX
MSRFGESLTDLLIATLASSRNSYLFKSILKERKLQRYKEQSTRNTLYRLQKKGYVCKSSNGWSLSNKGIKYFQERELYEYIPSPFKKDSLPNTIVAFDIPENKRKIRNWLRNQIKIFGYKMIQQSLWIGPGPLPTTFLKRLENLEVRKNIKTFRINKK